MSKTVINELNAFLKGEHMAIDSYERYLKKINTPCIRSEFEAIQRDHKNHAIKIGERIELLGGNPVNGVGFTGKIAETFSGIKNMGMKEDRLIVEDALNGESQGIKMAEEIVKGDLDLKSHKLIQEILETDKKHLTTLNNLLS